MRGEGVNREEERKEEGIGEARERKRKRRTPSRHILRTKHHLHRDKRYLHTAPRANTSEDLIAYPHPRGRVHFQSIKQGRADGEDHRPGPHEWCVPAESRNTSANHNRCERDAHKVRDRADAGTFGRGSLDGLEVKGKEVDVRVEAHGEEGAEAGACSDGSLSHDAWRDGGPVSAVELKPDEYSDEEDKPDDATPDF